MPIKLITGTPGAGKTLLALEELLKDIGVKDRSSLEAIRRQLHDPDIVKRPVVVCGVEGLQPDLFVEMENPLDWEEYEDGTIFLVDEAWKWFGVQVKKLKEDSRYLNFAEHRHRGMDFIMTCQMPSQIDQHLRGLVNPHLHVTRKFGTKLTATYEWPSVVSNPNSAAQKKLGIEKVWTHPAPIYTLYLSASLHTIKRHFPFKVVMLPVLAVVVLCAVGGAIWAASSFVMRDDAVGLDAGLAEGAIPVTDPKRERNRRRDPDEPIVVTGDDYLDLRVPRVPEIPGSAPIFDGRAVTSYPKLYCISVGEDPNAPETCRCVTEQNTRVNIDLFRCIDIARWGGMYDEYRPVMAMSASAEQGGPTEASGTLPEGVGSSTETVRGSGRASAGPAVDPSYGQMTRPQP